MPDISEIKKLHDKAYQANQVTRERAADDLVFYWVTQWDDNMLAESQLLYRGQFDVLRKAGRGILADLFENPVHISFQSKDNSREDGADLLNGLYRADKNDNRSLEAFEVSRTESVICGIGAWELYTEYESLRDDQNKQVIKRRPLYEANNTVYFDPNSRLIDKSDANYCSVIVPYSYDGYKELVEELTGREIEDDNVEKDSFKNPQTSYTFPWTLGETEQVYVGNFYYRELVKEKVISFQNVIGEITTLRESEIKDVMDEMLDAGYEVVAEKEIRRYRVTKYIVTGKEILAEFEIPGEHIPVVVAFGERAYVEGEEHYEGVTRLAKDPQRLRNFQLSYLADIVSRSPRRKPIFFAEQVAGFEDMYAEMGADNNYPYYLLNRFDDQGNELPNSPVGEMPEQPVPQALVQSIQFSREAVEDVANSAVPQDYADTDTSGKAVRMLQARIDMQSMVYREHMKYAMRRDGEVYVSMAKELYDVPRTVMTMNPDGTRKQVKIMETVIDNETGELTTLHDISNTEFDVYSVIGANYSSQKEETIERLQMLIQGEQDGILRQILILKLLKLMDGVDFEDVRDYANKQLVLMGIKKPSNPQEEKWIEEAAQQQNQPDPNMILAMAEDKKAQADLLAEQVNMEELKLNTQNEAAKRQIDVFNAETNRLNTQIKAQQTNADINFKNQDAVRKSVESKAKVISSLRPSSNTRA